VGRDAFAVMLDDDLIDAPDPLLPRTIDVSTDRSAILVALREADPSQIHLYGCAAVESTIQITLDREDLGLDLADP